MSTWLKGRIWVANVVDSSNSYRRSISETFEKYLDKKRQTNVKIKYPMVMEMMVMTTVMIITKNDTG